MPVISRFYGIIVRLMRLPDRRTALYANYGEHELVMDARTLRILSGNAPARVAALVSEWARIHQGEILAALGQPASRTTPPAIAPLE